MDYTLRFMISGGEVEKINCSTLADVSNQMYNVMNQRFRGKEASRAITFLVVDNTKMRENENA